MTSEQATREEATDEMIERALGEELRRTREAAGLSRAEFVTRLPSGIGERTLLTYEHGTRHLTVLRLLELCRVLEQTAPTMLAQALQRAQLELTNLVLRVDLRRVINDGNDKFRPLRQWAQNRLNRCSDGITEVAPCSVRELADFVGYTYLELASYLAGFMPESSDTTDTKISDVGQGRV